MDKNKEDQVNVDCRSRLDKSLKYIIGLIVGVMTFLGQQVYAELSSKPSKSEVEMIIEERVKPLETCISNNTSKISTFEVTLENLSIINNGINATLLRIDNRTIEQGKDISAIKVKVNQLD